MAHPIFNGLTWRDTMPSELSPPGMPSMLERVRAVREMQKIWYKKPGPLVTMAAEVRMCIYSHLLVCKNPIGIWGYPREPSLSGFYPGDRESLLAGIHLLSTCRLFRNEAMSILYSSNHFVTNIGRLFIWVQEIGGENAHYLRSVAIHNIFFDWSVRKSFRLACLGLLQVLKVKISTPDSKYHLPAFRVAQLLFPIMKAIRKAKSEGMRKDEKDAMEVLEFYMPEDESGSGNVASEVVGLQWAEHVREALVKMLTDAHM